MRRAVIEMLRVGSWPRHFSSWKRGRYVRTLAFVAFGVILLTAGNVPPSAGVERVTFMLSWLPVGEAAGWYVAQDKGYFARENLTVKIERGYGSGDAIKKIAAGRADFGIGDLATLVAMRARENVEVRGVAVWFSRAPYAIFYPANVPITGPKDLEGKTIVAASETAAKLMFPAFAKLTNVDAEKIRWHLVDPAAAIATFAANRGDLLADFANDAPTIEKQMKGRFGTMLYADFGFDVYSLALIARDDTVSKRANLTRRFVRGALSGLAYAIRHPEEAAAILVKYNPELDKDVSLKEWKIVSSLTATEEVKVKGLGYFVPARVQSTVTTVTDLFKLSRRLDPHSVYTNDFVPLR